MDFQLNLNTETVQRAGPIEPLCVPPQMTVREVLVLMRQHNIGSALVCADERLTGIFTERDALKLLATDADLDAPVSDAMAKNPATVSQRESVAAAIQKMTAGGYRHLPVVDDAGHPVSLLKVRGIVHYLVEHFPNTIYNLPPEPRPVSQFREGA